MGFLELMNNTELLMEEVPLCSLEKHGRYLLITEIGYMYIHITVSHRECILFGSLYLNMKPCHRSIEGEQRRTRVRVKSAQVDKTCVHSVHIHMHTRTLQITHADMQ